MKSGSLRIQAIEIRQKIQWGKKRPGHQNERYRGKRLMSN